MSPNPNPNPNPNWRTTNRTLQILHAAEAGQYGVLATVAYNIEHILGMIRAAELSHSPLIIQFFPWAITFSSGHLIRVASECAKCAKVLVAIHLDHAQDEEMIRFAAETLPFDSIMVDMSHFERGENLRRTEELVRFCHERGVAAEAEPGRIEGGEDGVLDTSTEGLEGSLTTMEEVRDFVGTGVEILAPAIGNMHGENPYGDRDPDLDFERLRKIREKLGGKVHIALHGTNGFKPELMKKCIAEGVSKVNVNRLVLDDYSEHLKTNAGKVPLTRLMDEGVEKVVRQTMEWMEICGSAGKA
ncbi:tagatose 1,6-diphosphate aldolase [Leptodontidium sp. 2 PMI_412]|nr:tagatose 1,6-diphosphate aldolase [Leptodontidium sp. MPI-SDFR-AT-0119]KAH9217939.1 tagatose 1,6-diphosphate aldolase [Leptodontidium sp. 2 PMI_412]